MTEGLKELLRHVSKECKAARLYATCAEKNVASSRVMEKIGMTLVEREENRQALKQGVVVTYTKLRYEIEL